MNEWKIKARGFTSSEFSNLRAGTRLPTSFRRHSRKTASFSAVAADGFAELNAVVFGIPPAATALEGPFATFDDTALGFESVKAVRAGAACNASFFPVMLMTGTQHGYAWRTADFFIATGILSSYSFYGLRFRDEPDVRKLNDNTSLGQSLVKRDEGSEFKGFRREQRRGRRFYRWPPRRHRLRSAELTAQDEAGNQF